MHEEGWINLIACITSNVLSKKRKEAILQKTSKIIIIVQFSEFTILITKGIEGSILDKKVTYDFHRLMDNATKVSCSGFAEEIINHM